MLTKRLCSMTLALMIVIAGLCLIFTRHICLNYLISSNLVLSPNSDVFKEWGQKSVLVPMDIYFFNWTNPQDIRNVSSKPKFREMGPYQYFMDMRKEDFVWNNNDTLTYKQKRFYYFNEKGTKGSLNDFVTTLNVPALGAAHQVNSWSYFAIKGFSWTLSTLYSAIFVNQTVEEFLFAGYDDPLTKTAQILGIEDAPDWDKFGFFYSMNGSAELDGVYNVGTGTGTKFAETYRWNYDSKTPYFEEECGLVRGSNGVKFDAHSDTIQLFASDLCQTITFQYAGDEEFDGIMGRKYVMGEQMLDNGTKSAHNKCHCNGDCLPSGLFNVTSCRRGNPTYISLPHFYQADPVYAQRVEGLAPNREKHEFSFVIEPTTGLPLEVNGRMQLNLLLKTIPGVSLFEDLPTIIFPVMWFEQRALMPEENRFMIKILLYVPNILMGSGIFMVLCGIAFFAYLVFVVRKLRSMPMPSKDEIVPLNRMSNK